MLVKSLAKQLNSRTLAKMSTFNLTANTVLSPVAPAQVAPAANAIKSYKEIPGPKTLPVLGSLFNIKSFGGNYDFMEFRDFQNHLQADFGDMVKWEIFNYKFVYLFNPELIKEVYKADGSTPLRPTADPMVRLHERIGLKLDLINSQGERWRKLRSLANPVMARPQNIHTYLENHNQIANDMVNVIQAKFDEGENQLVLTKFEQMLRLLTLEYVSELAFDHRIHCVNDKHPESASIQEVVNAIEEFFVQLGRLAFSFPFWRFYPTSDWRKFEKAGTFIYSIVRKYIEQAQRDLAEKAEKNIESDGKKSILEEFLLRKEKYDLKLEDVVSIMTDFLVAGVDTTSNSLYYMLYELGINPDIQERLYKEIDTVVGADKQVTAQHIEQMKYLKCVFKESMRLHSTVPANARILSQDLTLNSYSIPKGTIMLFANSHITSSERFFKNALKFDPSRWEATTSAVAAGCPAHHPYAALPFGHGVRMCVGRRVAEQELYLTLIKLVQAFKIDFVGEQAPGLKTSLIASPDQPLDLKFTRRA